MRALTLQRGVAKIASGCESAKSDIAADRLTYRWSGHAGHWGHWIVTQLAERFGVEVDDGFAVCFVDSANQSFNDGYSSILIAEIDRRHGAGTFQSLLDAARTQTEESLGNARRAWLIRHGLG